METLEDVLNEADSAGFPVSRSQLHRWRQAGIVPRPVRQGLGRGEGTESWYPTWTRDLVILIAHALEEKRDLTLAGWKAWMAGYPVPAFVREQMTRRIDSEKWIRGRLRDRAERGSVISILGPEIRSAIRHQFGKEDVLHIERLFAEMLLGEFEGGWLLEGKHARMIKALTKSSDPQMLEHVKAGVAYASKLLGTNALSSVMERISDEELRLTQKELIRLSGLLNPVTGGRGLGWFPVNLLHWWLPVRWGDSWVSQQVQDFFADPGWPTMAMTWIEENMVQ